jgi:hypothetical protein
MDVIDVHQTSSTRAPFGIFMRRTDHLGEVNNYWLATVPSDQNVEFVIVAMNKPRTCKSYNDVH